jgi:hypothetical protein
MNANEKIQIEKRISVKDERGIGGAGGIRTPYLCDANATFSRVNYGPRLASVTLTLKL